MNRCPACGTTYAAEAKFCPRDGSRLVSRSILSPSSAQGPSSPMSSTAPARPTELPSRPLRATPLTPANLIGKLLEGRYRMVTKVGEGGMSFVYLALDVATQERFAI